VSSTVYLEGGGDARDLQIRCREGFRKLLKRCSYAGRLPKLVASGGRGAAFDAFQTAVVNAKQGDFVALLIDSEGPLTDTEATWKHLQKRDGWNRPKGATDDQVLFMTTCMETWIVADRATLAKFYGAKLQVNPLPALHKLEERARDDIQDALHRATRKCGNAYSKGKRSFEVLGELDSETLMRHLPSFVRVRRILDDKL
jgi:hypothetical protein